MNSIAGHQYAIAVKADQRAANSILISIRFSLPSPTPLPASGCQLTPGSALQYHIGAPQEEDRLAAEAYRVTVQCI